MTTMKTKMLQPSIFLALSIITGVFCTITETSTSEDVWQSHPDIPIDSVSTAEADNKCPVSVIWSPLDCADIYEKGKNKSGVYLLWPVNRITYDTTLEVFCDMETDGGGWTVIQRRGNFQRDQAYFFKYWEDYKEGFGDKKEDFWLGNDYIFALTNQKAYSVRFDLTDIRNETSYALYDRFWIDDVNNNYTLHIYDYSGNAGDSMAAHNNRPFSTRDKDIDSSERNCALDHKSGWWFNQCVKANLNGVYYPPGTNGSNDGVVWETWKGLHESLQWTEIKIRPLNLRSAYG